MLTLAIDTATKVCTIALCRDKEILAEYTINMGMTHSEGLLPQLDQLLQRTGVQKQDIELGCQHGAGFLYRFTYRSGNGRGYGLQLAVLSARS